MTTVDPARGCRRYADVARIGDTVLGPQLDGSSPWPGCGVSGRLPAAAVDKSCQVSSHPFGLLPQDQVPGVRVDDELGGGEGGGERLLVFAGQHLVAGAVHDEGRRGDRGRVGGGRALTSPASVSRHTCAGMRAPSRTRPSRYHWGTGWTRGNQAKNVRTQAASTGSVSRSTSPAKDGRPRRLRGDPTKTRPATRCGQVTATCCATYPPLEDPNSTAEPTPATSINAVTSAATCASEYPAAGLSASP